MFLRTGSKTVSETKVDFHTYAALTSLSSSDLSAPSLSALPPSKQEINLSVQQRYNQAASNPVFTGWDPKHSALWGNQPLLLKHRLHEHQLFSRPALEELIERYPDHLYELVHMGAQGHRKLWRVGSRGDATGAQVIQAIADGRLWINLLHVNEVDRRYGELLDVIFDEIAERVPGYSTFSRINGILISSPRAQVYYHFDPSGQSLWQIEGSKRVYLYPPVPPFLTETSLEHVAMYRDEVGIKYEPWFDEFATVYELTPGHMMHWPLNSPHRVENLDALSVSMTTEYFTQDIRRKQMVTTANGLLRKAGIAPDRSTSGMGFWFKAALQAGVRRAGGLNKLQAERRKRTFKLDTLTGTMVDLPS
jgi:hypothetical protein